MLTKRQSEILTLIVLEYIKLAKPVGSNLICDRLNVSSATVRAEMAALEDLGLLEKTHTSSGRVPSEKGYRYYVDNLMEPKKISGEDMLKLQLIFNNHQLELYFHPNVQARRYFQLCYHPRSPPPYSTSGFNLNFPLIKVLTSPLAKVIYIS